MITMMEINHTNLIMYAMQSNSICYHALLYFYLCQSKINKYYRV